MNNRAESQTQIMNEIDLSFCIPTYNRAEGVGQLVTEILKCNDQKIEVIVLDNGSTDETMKILRAINDERLFIYSNGENKGVLYNILHVLTKARGRFSLFSLDKDSIDPAKIEKFKTFLIRHPGLACGYCEYHSKHNADFELFSRGFSAVKEIGYKAHHPSGYFFNNELLKSVDITKRFADFNFVGHFPLDFVFAELCMLGEGAIYHQPLVAPHTAKMAANKNSFESSGMQHDAYFMPQGRLNSAVNFTQHISTLGLTLRQKESLAIDRFIQGLIGSTLVYRAMMMNDDWCTHYHMQSRQVGWREMTHNGLDFYKQFIKRTRGTLDGGLFAQAAFKGRLFCRLLPRVLKRLFLLIAGNGCGAKA